MPTTQRTNTYTTRSDRQFDLWRIIILCSLAYILLPASIILCPERISAFSSNEGMDLPFVRTKIAGQMCHDAILTRKMRTTCVDISVLRLNSYELKLVVLKVSSYEFRRPNDKVPQPLALSLAELDARPH